MIQYTRTKRIINNQPMKESKFSPMLANFNFLRQHLPWKMAQECSRRRVFDLEDTQSWSVRNMTDKGIRQSIIMDLVHMVELGIDYVTADELVRLIADEEQRNRVLNQLDHKDVQSKLIKVGQKFKVRMTRENMQKCMDYSGSWHEGFEPYAKVA